ncbi:MAG: SH3 domain-containing protein, partial [Planctomycetota bacterium]|nr:SH3 domain-containing protein [Planctomycetota bacterium]
MLSFAAFTLIFPALPQEEAPSFLYAQVGEHAATVRSFCHSETPVLTDLLPDTPIRVVAQRQPWSRIQVPGGFEVWVYGEFVDREGDVGTLNATHVRARPLPATSAKSYPVGQFLKGDRVYILEEKEKWLRVRAPENLGAWVLSESIVLLDKAPANWDALWLEAMPEDAVSGMELVKEIPEEILVEDVPTEVVEKTPTEDIGLVKVDIAETSPEATATEVVSAEMDETIEEPKEPKSLDQLDEAEAGLTELSAMGWNSNLAGKIESILGAVLWTSDESATLERAQA